MIANVVKKERVIHFDILPMYNLYADVFAMDDVPEADRMNVARKVSKEVLARLIPPVSGERSRFA
jgi:hypothetical protein